MNTHFIPLDETKILNGLSNKSRVLTIQKSVDSTNTYVKHLPMTEAPLICVAEQQTQGRGRLERVWHSPLGENIYFSMRIPFHGELKQLSGFSLAIGLAVIEALHFIRLPNLIQIKWPNDLLYDEKKLAGVLIELDKSTNHYFVTIGIGINVNMLEGNIHQEWTSLRKITEITYDRNLLITALIQHLEEHVPLFFQHSLSYRMNFYRKHDALFNQEIVIQQGTITYQGVAKGITNEGLLILKKSDGAEQFFAAGESRILKV